MILSLNNVSKHFGATQALDAMSLDLHAGEVHAVVGENGAGKSTMIKIMTGVHRPSSGTVEVDGAPVVDEAPDEYGRIYARFADLLREGRSEVDARPLRLAADAFLVGERTLVAPAER